MEDRWSKDEYIEKLQKLFGEHPVRQEKTFDPDILPLDFPNLQGTDSQQAPPLCISLLDEDEKTSPLHPVQPTLNLPEIECIPPLDPVQHTSPLPELQYISPLEEVQKAPTLPQAQYAPSLDQIEHKSPLNGVQQVSLLPELEPFPFSQQGHVEHLPGLEHFTLPQSPLSKLYGPSPFESNKFLNENLDSAHSQTIDLTKSESKSLGSGGEHNPQAVLSSVPELLESIPSLQQPQPESVPSQQLDVPQAQNDSQNPSKAGPLVASHGDRNQNSGTTSHRRRDLQVDGKVHEPKLDPVLQAGGHNTKHASKGRHLGENQNLSLGEAEDAESDGSLEVRLSLSDEDDHYLSETLPLRLKPEPIEQKLELTESSVSRSSRTRGMTPGTPVGNAAYGNQQTEGSVVSQGPRITSPEAVNRAQKKSVTFVTPVRMPANRTSKRTIAERRATPRLKEYSWHDIRGRHERAEKEAAKAREEGFASVEEKERGPIKSAIAEGIEYAKSLNLQYIPLPEIERELRIGEDEGKSVPTIALELRAVHMQSSVIQSICCNPRSVKSEETNIEAGKVRETVVVPDEEMFGVLYRLVKNVVLHRLEGQIASFVSHILNKSINRNFPGYFCKKFILFVERLSTPHMLPVFHNYLFEKVEDVDITRAQREIELRFKHKLGSLKPESMLTAFIKKWERYHENSEFVKTEKKEMQSRSREYRRKRNFLSQSGVDVKLQRVPKQRSNMARNKADLRTTTEQYAHAFAWYSREIFLHDDIQSHYFLARFMMSNIHNRRAEEMLKCRVGRVGDVERADFFVNMEKYIMAIWDKIIKELRDFLAYADPAGLMEVLCSDMDPVCSLLVKEVNEQMNPPGRTSSAHAVLIPEFGNRIGSFCAKAFGKAEEDLNFKKRTLHIRANNIKTLGDVYDKMCHVLKE